MNRHPQETSRSQEIARINDLAVAAAYGGREAASQLIESLRPLMLKYARSFSLCGDPEDVCQDMAVYLLEFVRKTDVCKIKNFAGYFKMSMLKEFTKRVEREKERLALVEEIIASETEQISPSAEHESALFDGVTEGRILNCLHMHEDLTHTDRDLLFLKSCGHSPAKCSEILSLNLNTVYYRLRRLAEVAREMLRKGGLESLPCAQIYPEDDGAYADWS